jgi:hypothetical protein
MITHMEEVICIHENLIWIKIKYKEHIKNQNNFI